MALYLDLHALQSVPAANLNRDDLGSPKSVVYGSVPRLRVSSQAWKRPVRHGVEKELGERAARSRLVPSKVAAALHEAGWPDDLATFASEQVAASAGTKGLGLDKEGRTTVLLFLPTAAIDELAQLCGEHRAVLEEKQSASKPGQLLPTAEVEAILKRRTVSISLLGRMLAELPGANVDGAVHMAHPFTTHASEPQRDYFTAVDDWQEAADTGSGHLNTAEFGAGVFYRYACVNLEDLVRNLDGDVKTAREALTVFADEFVSALPQAKRTSTAPHTLPDLLYTAVRKRRPLSLAAAFETPVTADDAGGFSGPSRRALNAYAGAINRLTGSRNRPFHGHATVTIAPLEHLGENKDSFDDLIEAAAKAALPDAGDAR
ncbi:type I-E CRISPR-associated protein Cas7/Cse4/CasC [Streptomyces sp. PU-14G]|uniref:type I-E CRISPR-associated protein Cas7/Cse4/CasC n=1 Tax=Streptomyces sp. PU-14G TaxID=2800808 RepID=UPI0034DF3B03